MAVTAPIDPAARFERLKSQAKQETTAQVQSQKEALDRRFAQLGMLNSGAAIKQQQIAGKEGNELLGKRLGEIQSLEETENLRKQETEDARAFARSEREASQGFASSERKDSQGFAAAQAEIGRKYATGERLSSQEFGALQADLQRKFVTGERLSTQDFANAQRIFGQDFASKENMANRQGQINMMREQQGFQADQSKLARDLQRQAMTTQESQFAQQYDLEVSKFDFDKIITGKNLEIADKEAGKKSSLDTILTPITAPIEAVVRWF